MGIIPTSSKVGTYCANSVLEDKFKCSSYLKTDLLKTDLTKHCVGKKACNVSNLPKFIDNGADGFNAEECNSKNSQMFIQVACMVSDFDV